MWLHLPFPREQITDAYNPDRYRYPRQAELCQVPSFPCPSDPRWGAHSRCIIPQGPPLCSAHAALWGEQRRAWYSQGQALPYHLPQLTQHCNSTISPGYTRNKQRHASSKEQCAMVHRTDGPETGVRSSYRYYPHAGGCKLQPPPALSQFKGVLSVGTSELLAVCRSSSKQSR